MAEIGKNDPNSVLKFEHARKIALEYQMTGVVIFGVRPDGVIDVCSYADGPMKAKKSLAEWALGTLERLPSAPFQTMFGWGKKGVPTKLTEGQLRGLSTMQIDFVTRNTSDDAV